MPSSRLLAPIILAAALVALLTGVVSSSAALTFAALAAMAPVMLLELTVHYPLRRDLVRIAERARKIQDGAVTAAEPLTLLASETGDAWRDISRLNRAEILKRGQLAAELGRAKAVLAYYPDPVLLIDRHRLVIETNSAAEELLGDHLIGRDLAAAIRIPAVLSATDTVLAGSGARVIEFDLNVPVERSMRARIDLVSGDQPVALIALTDFTLIKRAEQLRADFVANASHELRTPLSTVIGFIETLEGPAADDEMARQRFLPIMRQQAARMARLVDDLLSLSRIELNEHLPPRGRADLLAVLRAVVQALDLKASARGMRLTLASAASDPIVTGDPEELSQVFQNLIDNAIKYGNSGTDIAISLERSDKSARGYAVAIRDHGEGIARSHLPRLTERFYRVDTARSREMGGTGLGLAIVKHIISRYRGQLDIESEVGLGSVFTVHLPAAASMTLVDPIPIATGIAALVR